MKSFIKVHRCWLSVLLDNQMNFSILATMTFPDHHAYTADDVEMILKTAETSGIKSVITTEKDAVKIKAFAESYKTSVNIYALKLSACADFQDIVSCR